MADKLVCSPGKHDYLPPVVVRCERKGLSWMLIFGDSSRGSWEKAVTFCRHCGRMLAYGWQPAGMVEEDDDG